MKSLGDFHIVHERRQVNPHTESVNEDADDFTSEWLDHPDRWDRQSFIACATVYLQQKNGGVDFADKHLLSMLASQIEVYVQSILNLRVQGLTMNFNGGVTVGPNPCMAIADKALYRIVQVMKELELSPRSRDGYQSRQRISPELRSLLNGP